MSPERLKRKAKRRSAGSFICPLCGKGFTRRSTVKDPHFPACVARHGNPNNVQWDADESCRAKRAGRKNSGSSSATCVPELLQQSKREGDEGDNPGREAVILDDEEEKKIKKKELEHQQETMMMASWQDKDVAGGGGVEEEVEETDVPSMTSGRWNPINRLRTPGFAIIEDEDEDESMEDLPETPPSGRNPPSQTFSPETPLLPIECRRLLSVMTMNQLVNIPIKSCRMHAGKGDKEAQNMWHMWNQMLLPQDSLTKFTPPTAGLDQKSRQQTIVWMAQDVYAILLNRVRGLRDQLQMAVVWRDIAQGMGDVEGVAKIHDLLVVELGEEGPMLLGEFGGVDLGLWME